MISRLRGIIAENNGDSVVLDVNGIGFEVLVGAQTAALLSGAGSEDVTLYTYLYLREDAMVLYGFPSRDELSLFRQLITVSGIGPKGGLSLLSSLGADDLRFAILSGDAKTLSKAPGIGRKTAERLVLELKDKISKTVSGMEKAVSGLGAPVMPVGGGTAYDDALTALSVLGYSTSDVVPVLRQINTEGMTTEQIIKAVLKFMI